jgi:hypothetical protein
MTSGLLGLGKQGFDVWMPSRACSSSSLNPGLLAAPPQAKDRNSLELMPHNVKDIDESKEADPI